MRKLVDRAQLFTAASWKKPGVRHQVFSGAVALALVGGAAAQVPPGLARDYCDGDNCTDTTIEVTFDGKAQSVLEIEKFTPNAPLEIVMVMDVKEDKVQGWSYGVEHDGDLLRVLSGTTDGTDVSIAGEGGFKVVDFTGILSCKDDPDPKCPNPKPGAGWVSGVILSFTQPISLEVRRNTITRARYALVADPGPRGTRLQVVDYLRKAGSLRTDINITIDGFSKKPRTLVDGLVRTAGAPFRRGDCDLNGALQLTDAICMLDGLFRGVTLACDDAADADDDGELNSTDVVRVLLYLFGGGAAPPAPFASCGPDPTGDALGCAAGPCG